MDIPAAIRNYLEWIAGLFDDSPEALRILVKNTRFVDTPPEGNPRGWYVSDRHLPKFASDHMEMWERRLKYGSRNDLSILLRDMDISPPLNTSCCSSGSKGITLGYYDRRKDPGAPWAYYARPI